MTERVLFEEVELLRTALNAAIGLIDGISRNVAPDEEAEREVTLRAALHELVEFGYTERNENV